jgi:hypothetical protein
MIGDTTQRKSEQAIIVEAEVVDAVTVKYFMCALLGYLNIDPGYHSFISSSDQLFERDSYEGLLRLFLHTRRLCV